MKPRTLVETTAVIAVAATAGYYLGTWLPSADIDWVDVTLRALVWLAVALELVVLGSCLIALWLLVHVTYRGMRAGWRRWRAHRRHAIAEAVKAEQLARLRSGLQHQLDNGRLVTVLPTPPGRSDA